QIAVDCLGNNNSNERLEAVQALGDLANEARDAIPKLIPLLDDSDKDVRDETSNVLARERIGLPDKADHELIVKRLADGSQRIRVYAAQTVRDLVEAKQLKDAPQTIDTLIEALKDRE